MGSEPQPTCLVCGRPIATAEQLDTILGGEGTHLCWDHEYCELSPYAMRSRIEELGALLPKAFDAGVAWCRGNHEDFKQTHPDRDTWVRSTLGQ